MPLSAFQQFCADTGCPDNVHTLALWTQRNDAVAALKECEAVKQGYHDALIKAAAERDKLKAEREQMEKQEPVNYLSVTGRLADMPRGDGTRLIGFVIDSDKCDGLPLGDVAATLTELLGKLYAHPPVPDGKVLVDAERYRFIRNQEGWPTPEEFDAMVDGDMLKAAQQGG